MSPCCLYSSAIPVKLLQHSGPLWILTPSEINEQQLFNLSMHVRNIWKTVTILGGGVSFTECCYGDSSWNEIMVGEVEIVILLHIKDEFIHKKREFSESPKRFRSLTLTDLLLYVGAGVAQAFLKVWAQMVNNMKGCEGLCMHGSLSFFFFSFMSWSNNPLRWVGLPENCFLRYSIMLLKLATISSILYVLVPCPGTLYCSLTGSTDEYWDG